MSQRKFFILHAKSCFLVSCYIVRASAIACDLGVVGGARLVLQHDTGDGGCRG